MATIAELLEDANELTAMAAGLNDRTISWSEWNPDLTCFDRQEVAAEEAAIAMTAAWKRLEEAELAERRKAA